MGTWYNSDGLLVKLGTSEATPTRIGEYVTNGAQRQIEFTVLFGDIKTADTIYDHQVSIPAGAYINRVELEIITAFTGSSSTFNVGGYLTDESAVDASGGFISALALASMTPAGVLINFINGTTGKGSYIGTTLTNAVLISTKWGTAAFTAGKGIVRIYYSWPD